MASYRYTVTIELLKASTCKVEENSAREAISLTKAQHRLRDGTTVTITRRILNRWSPTDGPELPYRRYVVQGGIVRRVDR